MTASTEAYGQIRLLAWRRVRQNSLRGFASIQIAPPGLVIYDLPVHRNGESCYALMPGKPEINRAGQVLVDDRGKRKYTPIVEIPDRDLRERIKARDHETFA